MIFSNVQFDLGGNVLVFGLFSWFCFVSFWGLGRRTQFTLALRSTGVGTGVIRGHKWHIFFSIISKQNYLYLKGCFK